MNRAIPHFLFVALVAVSTLGIFAEKAQAEDYWWVWGHPAPTIFITPYLTSNDSVKVTIYDFAVGLGSGPKPYYGPYPNSYSYNPDTGEYISPLWGWNWPGAVNTVYFVDSFPRAPNRNLGPLPYYTIPEYLDVIQNATYIPDPPNTPYYLTEIDLGKMSVGKHSITFLTAWAIPIEETRGCGSEGGTFGGSLCFQTGLSDVYVGGIQTRTFDVCVPNHFSGCSSSATNSCGDTRPGFIQCDGSCSATSAPDERPYWSIPAVYPAGSTLAFDLDGVSIGVSGGVNCRSADVKYYLQWENQDRNINEGWASDWIENGGTSSITLFTNYPPGTYNVRARAYDRNGNWSDYSGWRAITLSEVACTAANVCGQTRNGAQRDHRHGSGGYCNVGPPPVTTPNGTTYGAACPLTSIGNACGQTATADTGAIQCNGSCVGTPPNPPSNLSCPPTKPTVQGLFQDGASLGNSAPAFNDEGYEVRAYSISPGNQKLRYFFEWSKDGVNWTEGDRPGRPAGEWNTR